MTRRLRWLGLSLILGTALLSTLWNGPSRADEPAAPAAAPAPAPAAPDPTTAPVKPDSTGASYAGANTSAALTGEKDPKTGKIKVTQESLTADVKDLKIGMNMLWTLITGFLVMFMQSGFALLETGLTRAKNVAHTMAMNFVIYAIGVTGFWISGFAFQFGGIGSLLTMDGPSILDKMWTVTLFGKPFDLVGYKGFFLAGPANDATVLTIFLFQMVFMDTAATIPTGALAERWKFSAFVVYGFFMSMIIYPVFAAWTWGGGWLSDLGVNFGLGNGHVDFAGSSVVHMTGAVTSLAGVIILGPRIGKFNKDGSANAIPPHSIPLAALGTLILAFGWFGFNPGSTLAATDLRIGSVATCTMLASAAGCLTSMFYMWIVFGKPDPSMACNGLLAGLVAITAPSAFVNPVGAMIIGAIAGVLVVWGVLFFERVVKVDDPVGAIAVHGVNGAWGCLSIGFFATGEYGAGWNGVATAPTGIFYGGGFGQLAAEAIGVVTNFVWVFSSALVFFWIIDKTLGMRVSALTEIQGLDIHEMGVAGYFNEDTDLVQLAGEEHLSTHGPGVPKPKKVVTEQTIVGRS
ncbi:MAG: ammonium transporter [Planctomycetaceae bacterium]|nr:ammonium transporter [Planctomycetaceae bacterium]